MESKLKMMPSLAMATLLFAMAPAAMADDATSQGASAVQAEFDAAMRDLDADRLRSARERLLALLATNPSLSRARLELARVYYQSRDYDQARVEAQRVLDDPNTPPAVKATVLAFLAQINADEKQFAQRHEWAPSLYAGLMYDSNVNIGPSRDVIDVGGVPFNVAPDSRETADFAAVINPGIAHTFNPGRRFEAGEHRGFFLWQSQANAYYRAYFDENDYNLGILTARTGPAWVVPGKWRASLGLQGDQIFLGGDSLAFYTTLNPDFTFQAGRDTEVSLSGNLSRRHYWDNDESGRDGWYRSADVFVSHYFNRHTMAVQFGGGWAGFDADEDRFSYSGPDFVAGFLWQAWRNGVVYARVNYRGYDYDGLEPLFEPLGSRDDDEWRYTAGFQHDFTAGALRNWSLVGTWVHTDNQSNIPIYDYDRDIANLGLARRF